MSKFKKLIQVYFYTLKYWLQGDDWGYAYDYANALVYTGWKHPQ